MANKKLTLGQSVKITGGKYKKLGTGVLKTLKPTYCDVLFDKDTHKVKIDYIFPIDDMVIDMPEAEQLQDVGQNPDDFIAGNPEVMKADEEVEEMENASDVAVDDIHEVCHPDDEEFDNLSDQISELEKKCEYYISESSVFEAERDQADSKVMEQSDEIEKLKSKLIALTGRNQYLEGICRKLLLP